MLPVQIMEFFGFASGNSSTGPDFPFLLESVLTEYPAELTGHPAMPSIPLFPYDFVLPVDLSYIYQGFGDCNFEPLQSPLARSIGAGIIAAAVIYCTWKTTSDVDTALGVHEVKNVGPDCNKEKGSTVELTANKPTLALPINTSTTIACVSKKTTDGARQQLANVSEKFQRQLIDALTKLDDVRFRLKELESEKELLNAEICLRKKITQKLHVENSSEREKRQQAELKMEMMEIEVSQLRQLRKALAVKTGQVEKLEMFVKEKDELQIKLFEDNVVLPRIAAETRAKEFRTLQTRIHQLQAEVDATKHLLETSAGSQLIKSSDSRRHKDSSASHSSPIICEVPELSKNFLTETSTISVESNNSDKGPNTKRKLAARSPNISRLQTNVPKVTRSRTSPDLGIPNRTPQEKTHVTKELCIMNDSKVETSSNLTTTTSIPKSEDFTNIIDTPSNKGVGVFAQIRAMISGFRDSSSESEFIKPLEHTSFVDEQVVDRPPTNMVNNLERHQDYPLSDEQSSIFMSASGGSGGSDTDLQRCPATSNSKSVSKKSLPLKRLSRYKRDRRRNIDKASKRKLAKYLSSGHVGTMPERASDSSDWSQKSTVKNCPVAAKSGSNSQIYSKCSVDSQDPIVFTLESSDQNDADSGDSWIVIMPPAS